MAAGFVLVGAFAALTSVAGPAALADAMRELVPAHRAAALQSNLDALDAGAAFVAATATSAP
jgi:Pyruvate/2-oxoacid:ferredoxin oxidoreductase gamma subunit